MDQEKIGKFIKEIRTSNHMTQQQFADKYNVTYQAVSKWENGKNIPDIALIKQISNDFNVDINDILEGRKRNKKINKLLIGVFSFIIIGLIIMIFLYSNKDSSFKFKTISSNCDNFNISGSISYNKSKTSIYVSNIEYCGGDDNTSYKNIDCVLYEKSDNVLKKITNCKVLKNKNITLEEYLKEVKFVVDNYEANCKDYAHNKLFIEINATSFDNKVIKYNIPLSLEDDC